MDDTRLRPSKLRNWKPKKWRVEYENIVLLSIRGLSNKMIAQEVGMTPQHISNILNLDEAEEIRQKVLIKLRDASQETTLADNLEYIATETVNLLKECFNDADRRKSSPFALIDRGMDVIKGLGHLKGGGNGSPGVSVEKAIIIQGEAAAGFMEGLTKADAVRKLHNAESVDAA